MGLLEAVLGKQGEKKSACPSSDAQTNFLVLYDNTLFYL